MPPIDEPVAATPGQPSPAPTPPSLAEARLAHLFRHSLRDGRLHPLYPLLRKYRQEAGQP